MAINGMTLSNQESSDEAWFLLSLTQSTFQSDSTKATLMSLPRIILALWCSMLFSVQVSADVPLAEQFLLDGKTKAGAIALADRLSEHPDDNQARFGLGVVQFVGAVDRLGQNFYQYGLRDVSNSLGNMIPLLRLPVPQNPNPETLTYEDSRRILQAFIDDLAIADATLAKVDDSLVKLPLHVTGIKLDFVGNGSDPVALQTILKSMRAVRDDRDLFVVFDRADVTWLRGYCHLLSGICEFVLAHDGQEIFDSTAQLFFQKVKSPYPYLQEGRRVFDWAGQFDIADAIAFIHLIRMPVKEPERMKAALKHLETVLEYSGEMWRFALAETDNDHEWIPNPKQQGELGLSVSQAMIDSWLLAAKEGTEVLQGKRLIPFWRGNGDRGVNLHRVFTEPTSFDLVLWIQGTAAAPYLEQGDMTRPEVWARMQQVFQGNFIVFALWFN